MAIKPAWPNPQSADATQLIPLHLRLDIAATLARLRMARTVDPKHQTPPNPGHTNCDVCTSERRLDWLLSQIPRANTPER